MATALDVTRRNDVMSIPAANTALHAEIVDLSGNSMLKSAMAPAIGLMQWLFTMTSDRDARVQCAEHEQICEAIKAGNADLAAALSYAHIELGRVPSFESLAGILPDS